MKDFLLNIDPTMYLLAIGYVIAILFISWKQGWIIFVPHKKTTIGKVTSVEWDGPNISYKVDGQSLLIKFRCRDIEGLKEEVKFHLAQKQSLSTPIGKEFKIAYNANNPQQAKVCPSPYAFAIIIFAILIGVAVIFQYSL